MGAVYQAYDLALQREVAIKLIHPHFARKRAVARVDDKRHREHVETQPIITSKSGIQRNEADNAAQRGGLASGSVTNDRLLAPYINFSAGEGLYGSGGQITGKHYFSR